MSLHDMKQGSHESDENFVLGVSQKEVFPIGLAIHLENDQIERLEMKEMPEVGTPMMMVAKVKVTHVSKSEDEEGPRKSMTLQIIEMELEKPDGEQKSRAERIFNSDGRQVDTEIV